MAVLQKWPEAELHRDPLPASAPDSSVVSGMAGSLVRVMSDSDSDWRRAVVGAIIGGVSAVYLTPLILWILSRYTDIGMAEVGSLVQSGISFCIGLTSIYLASILETIAIKFTGGKK